MKTSWLGSKPMSDVFTVSAWGVVCSLTFTILHWPPSFPGIEKTVGGNPMMTVLFLAFFAVGVLGLLIIMIGMAIFCLVEDRSSVGKKIIWFLVFFLTAPVGSVVYFFSVYKKMVATQREAVND
jgi:hypothetical protein